MQEDMFFVANKEALIYESMPHMRHESAQPSILSRYPAIVEFAKQKFSKVQRNSLKLHYNEGIEICYVHKGYYNWVAEGRNYTLYPGDAFVTCPWELHGSPIGTLNRGCLSWIIIAPQSFDKDGNLYMGPSSTLDSSTLREIGNILVTKDSHILHGGCINHILHTLQQELFTPSLGTDCLISQLLDRLLIETARNIQQKVPRNSMDPEISRFIEQLESQFAENWTIELMAKATGMHPLTLIGRCKRFTGNTPIQLLTEIRMKHAKEKMEKTNLPITQIAYECGFSSIQYFSEIFKKLNGYAPKEFREKLKRHTHPHLPQT